MAPEPVSSRQTPGTETVVEYDGSCDLCLWSVNAAKSLGLEASYTPVDGTGRDGVVLRKSGRDFAGYEAVLGLLSTSNHRLLKVTARVGGMPGLKSLGCASYRLISRHRHSLSRQIRRRRA